MTEVNKVKLRLQKDGVNRTAKSIDLIRSPKCCTIVPAKIHPTPKSKEQEHRICEVSVAPRPGMARMAMSMAIETPAYQNKNKSGGILVCIALTRVT